MNERNITRTQQEFPEEFELRFDRSRIGPYRIVREISRGGMGIVFESFQEELGRKVAIKALPIGSCHTTRAAVRFKREAETLAGIRHPGVAQVFDFGKDEHCYFLVMEYIDGETLDAKIRERGRLNEREAAALMLDVCRILEELHERSIVHRDLKPSNIMIRPDKTIVLLDFGISRCLGEETLSRITREAVGTPAYMPPELIRSEGRDADRRSDIYSLGVVLYEMLCGELPFENAGSAYPVIEKIMKADYPAPREKNAAVPVSLENLILRCMAPEPRERYADARALAKDLERYLEGGRIRAKRRTMPRTGRASRRTFYRAALFLLVAGGLVFANRFLDTRRSNKPSWKKLEAFRDGAHSPVREIYKDIEGETRVLAHDQFVSWKPGGRGLTWLRNLPGYAVLGNAPDRDIRIRFETGPPRHGEFFGAFAGAGPGLTGYLMKIDPSGVSLCRNYYENAIKKKRVRFSETRNRFALECLGAECRILLNGEEIIHFIDYDPLIGEGRKNYGLFFNRGFRTIRGLEASSPRQPLMVSPLIVGQRFYELAQYRNAIREYRKIVREYPDKPISDIARLRIGMARKGLLELDRAIAVFDGLIRENDNPDILPEAYFQKGLSLSMQGKMEEGEAVFLDAIHRFDNPDISLNIFLSLFESQLSRLKQNLSEDDLLSVEKRYLFMREHFPERRPLLTTATRMLISEWIQRGLGDKALSHLATLEKYFPRQKTTLAWGGIVRGDLHRAGKEYDAALEAYRTVFENYPDLGIYADWARERAASVLENLGQSGPARELRQKVRDPGRENGFRPNRVPVANIDAEKENRSEKR